MCTIPNQEIRLGIVHTYKIILEELEHKFLRLFFYSLLLLSTLIFFKNPHHDIDNTVHQKYIEYFVNIFKTLFY